MRASWPICLLFTVAAMSGTARGMNDRVDAAARVSIVEQKWRHEPKLLIVEITFRNSNPFSVKGVIAFCEIRGDPAKPWDQRGVTVRQNLSRGNTTVAGLEFSVTSNKAEGGPCRVGSAERGP